MSNMTIPENVRIFEDRVFARLNGPLAEGWYHCKDLKEIMPFFPPYKGELDNDMLHWIGASIPDSIINEFAGLCKEYPNNEVKALLFYSVKKRDWHMYIPEQKGSGASVTYDASDYDPPASYYFMGSIHTHPEMGAFWSATDMKDVSDKDGVHIVFALRKGIYYSYKCSLFKGSFEYPHQDLITLPAEGTEFPVPSEEVKNRIKIPSYPAFTSNYKADTSEHLNTLYKRGVDDIDSSYWKDISALSDAEYSDSLSGSISDDDMFEYADAIIGQLTYAEALRFCSATLSLLGHTDLADQVESHLQAAAILEEEEDTNQYYEGVNSEFLCNEKDTTHEH